MATCVVVQVGDRGGAQPRDLRRSKTRSDRAQSRLFVDSALSCPRGQTASLASWSRARAGWSRSCQPRSWSGRRAGEALIAPACVVLNARTSVVVSVPIWAALSAATWLVESVETCVVVRLPTAVVLRPGTWAVGELGHRHRVEVGGREPVELRGLQALDLRGRRRLRPASVEKLLSGRGGEDRRAAPP